MKDNEITIAISFEQDDLLTLIEYSNNAGFTFTGLVKAFCYDLIGSEMSQGSDERMYAEQWYERTCLL